MNIIIDEKTHLGLQNFVINTIEFGSAMKGTANINSDHDYLHIISPSSAWAQSPVNTHHLLQYKSEDADHIYCTPDNFVKCLLDGDSTIFHEMLRYGALDKTCLGFLRSFKFEHYKTLRAYLGIARRDLKEATKLFNKDERKALKKLQFAADAYNYYHEVRYNTDKIYDIGSPKDIHRVLEISKELSSFIDMDRRQLSSDLDAGTVQRTISIEDLELIQTQVQAFSMSFYTHGLTFFFQSHIEGN